ncbi:hypothetical protein NDU88_009817 [Pleurodeles waltl]|uniref:Uncharacterized protein n=1 Tax=Pleurodeles waltl TaxID=8319 RepID=A0AAV7QWU2_PLEWA|nr:hypothetical protein NDU88_009817 [Pleurodeles waltl]
MSFSRPRGPGPLTPTGPSQEPRSPDSYRWGSHQSLKPLRWNDSRSFASWDPGSMVLLLRYEELQLRSSAPLTTLHLRSRSGSPHHPSPRLTSGALGLAGAAPTHRPDSPQGPDKQPGHVTALSNGLCMHLSRRWPRGGAPLSG